MDKVTQVAEHVNMILRYVPYIQTNFVLGLDCDEGPEPFELTKRFLDLAPGAFPAYSLLSAFGRAAPLNLEYQRAGRILPFPFHFLNNNHAMNVRPANYRLDGVLRQPGEPEPLLVLRPGDPAPLRGHAGRDPAVDERRARDVVRGMGSDRVPHADPRLLDTDRDVSAFLHGETDRLPAFYANRLRNDLGDMYQFLPPGGDRHDPVAYLRSVEEEMPLTQLSVGAPAPT